MQVFHTHFVENFRNRESGGSLGTNHHPRSRVEADEDLSSSHLKDVVCNVNHSNDLRGSLVRLGRNAVQKLLTEVITFFLAYPPDFQELR
ncbi:hypothetical protein GmarT_26800 [Gimesia maris]|uniref:Uncharacterized protein n=1 Tax=Gimesia maris TaxID=122 RepID=A0ABX5YMJ1_9PLAN|nr:hypothetical protein GmarT_26800 [Gimesia maris]